VLERQAWRQVTAGRQVQQPEPLAWRPGTAARLALLPQLALPRPTP
jgi:hypothetical protein